MNAYRLTFIISMITSAASSRLLPHPPNFTPIAALALFGGATFPDKRVAFLVPAAALFLTDVLLGFSILTPIVYGSFGLIVCLGFWLRRRRAAGAIAAAALSGAVLFFILTNFGVWALTARYEKTLAGLGQCFVAAVPFFRNTLAGDLIYSGLLFGGLALAEKRWPRLAENAPAVG